MKKKTLLILAAIAITGIGAVIINACSKSDSNLQTQKSYEYKEFIPAQEDVVFLIEEFNAAYKEHNLGYKSGEDMPLNEALWNLEAGVNYEFCEPKDHLNNLSTDSTFVTVNLINGENGELLVPGDDLMDAYTDLLAFTNNQLNGGNEQMVLMVADVELKDVAGQEATFKMTTEKGHPSPPSCEIEDDDYWYYANELGKCGPYVGQQIGKDASTRMNYILNCTAYSCPGGTVFFTSITTYLLVPAGGDYPNTCYDPQSMQYLLDDNWDRIDYYQPTGKVYIDCIYIDDVIPGGSLWGHIFEELRYGVLNCKPNETK
ncbi:MAG: hypothetical protein H8D45_04255 [Bacteroidetes bacterium]|nr:hypothetical protein [Bacteroidota bacterium]MBL7103921.1 hypothetical protein [Bacteroidales bacterium]